MDDHGRCSALTSGFFIFIRPAAIIGHRAAIEGPLKIFVRIIGIIDQDDDSFALYVDPCIIIPAALRRVNAVSDEHHFGIADLCFGDDPVT